jgi:hypothetical protein
MISPLPSARALRVTGAFSFTLCSEALTSTSGFDAVISTLPAHALIASINLIRTYLRKRRGEYSLYCNADKINSRRAVHWTLESHQHCRPEVGQRVAILIERRK